METELVAPVACRSCFPVASAFQKGNPLTLVLAGVFVNPVKREGWSPSQEACSAFLAHRWQHLYCEQVLWACACERMCHTYLQAYPLGNLELQRAGSGVARADLSLLGETDTDTDCCYLVWQRT